MSIPPEVGLAAFGNWIPKKLRKPVKLNTFAQFPVIAFTSLTTTERPTGLRLSGKKPWPPLNRGSIQSLNIGDISQAPEAS